MDLEFSEEQQKPSVDMTRALLEEHSSVEIVRQMEDDPKGYPDALWKQMAELRPDRRCSFPRATAAAGSRFSRRRSSTKRSAAPWRRCRTS